MTNKVCTLCGKKAFGECQNYKCKEHWQRHWEKRVNEKIADYQKEIENLQKINADILTIEDFLEVKKISKEVKEWEKQLNSSPVKSQVEKLLKEVGELEKKFPERIKLKYKYKNSSGYQLSCSHNNIAWNDFFKTFKEKTEEPYCLDCGEDENTEFTKKFQKWYCQKIEEWLKEQKLKKFEFSNWLKKTADNHYDIWWELKKGKFVENIKDELTIFQEMSSYIEEYCLEFAKEEGVNVDKSNQIKSNQIKSNQIKSNQIKSNQIKSNQVWITSVLTPSPQ